MPVCPWQAPFHQLGSELSMTWIKSPRRNPSSPSSWGSKSKRAWTYVGCCRRGQGKTHIAPLTVARPLEVDQWRGNERGPAFSHLLKPPLTSPPLSTNSYGVYCRGCWVIFHQWRKPPQGPHCCGQPRPSIQQQAVLWQRTAETAPGALLTIQDEKMFQFPS